MNLKKSLTKRITRIADKLDKLFAPAPLRTYNHIISCGCNCEVAFQFLTYHNFLEAHIFNWCYIYSTSDLVKAIREFDSVGQDFRPHAPMWQDVGHMINFHGRAKAEIWSPDANPTHLQEDKAELISRVAHLKSKFKSLTNSTESLLFVYKPHLEELNNPESLRFDTLSLRDALSSFGMKQFDILLVVTHDSFPAIQAQFTDCPESSGIIIESISCHAPIESVTSGPFDKKGWRHIWAKYATTYRPTSKNKKYKFNH